MKNPRSLITALAAAAILASPAQANLILSHGGNSLSLFTDSGTKILDYSTTLVNPQAVVTDNTGHVYVAEYGTPGAYDGNVKMYDIASGTFIRDILSPNLYAPTGVAFNPANPGEIIVIAQYSAGASQLGRWFTSATGAAAAVNSALGVPYAGLYYNPTISGGAQEGIYVAAPAGAVQYYNSSTLNWGPYEIPAIPDIGVAAPNGITGLGTDLFFASNTGDVFKYSGGVLTPLNINPGGDFYYGIATDGTDLWVAQYGTGFAARYNTSGVLQSFFAAPFAVGITYTTINPPYPVINNASFEMAFTGDPTTGWANAEGGGWGNGVLTGLLSPEATDGLNVAFGNGGTAYQIINNHTILAGTYTILVDVGRRNDGFYTPFSMSVFSVNGPGGVQALGGYSLATDPPVGGWSTLTATITIANGNPAIGGNLQLNLGSPGVQTVVDNVRISYAAPGGSYTTWADAYGAADPPLLATASTADPDYDGLTNAVEYALGLDPRFSSGSPGVTSNNGKTITFTKGAEAKANGDVTYQIEVSETLGVAPSPWTPATSPDLVETADTIAITFPAGPVKNFARLKVTLASP